MIFKNQRTAYGETLVELGKENKNVVVLESDLSKSTMSCLFEQAFPERFFEMGIAEQNMTSTAAGFALAGKIPFISSFAVFASGRAYDQIRQSISIGKLNVNICGSSSGLSDFADGATHQAVEDVAIMRAIPNMTVLVPSDAVETRKMVKAMANHSGPVYIRLNRNDLPVLNDENMEFEIGKVFEIKDGRDAVAFVNGLMVSKALEAAEKLEKEGISLKIVNVSTVKPFNTEAIVSIAAGFSAVVVAEEHSVIGGLGNAVADALKGEPGKVIEAIGIKDSFGISATNYEELLECYGLTVGAIVESVKKAIAKGR